MGVTQEMSNLTDARVKVRERERETDRQTDRQTDREYVCVCVCVCECECVCVQSRINYRKWQTTENCCNRLKTSFISCFGQCVMGCRAIWRQIMLK